MQSFPELFNPTLVMIYNYFAQLTIIAFGYEGSLDTKFV
jgi:hypothetical protein